MILVLFFEESRRTHGPVGGRTLSAEHDAISVVPKTPEKQESEIYNSNMGVTMALNTVS